MSKTLPCCYAARGRWETLSFLSCQQVETETVRKRKERNGPLGPASHSQKKKKKKPQKVRVHIIGFAGSPAHCVPRVFPARSWWWKRKIKISWEKLVFWLKPESMHPKLEAQTSQIHCWTNYHPCCQIHPFPAIWKKLTGSFHQPFHMSWGDEDHPQLKIRNITN